MQHAVVLTLESENETLVVLFMIVLYNRGLNVSKMLKSDLQEPFLDSVQIYLY